MRLAISTASKRRETFGKIAIKSPARTYLACSSICWCLPTTSTRYAVSVTSCCGGRTLSSIRPPPLRCPSAGSADPALNCASAYCRRTFAVIRLLGSSFRCSGIMTASGSNSIATRPFGMSEIPYRTCLWRASTNSPSSRTSPGGKSPTRSGPTRWTYFSISMASPREAGSLHLPTSRRPCRSRGSAIPSPVASRRSITWSWTGS